MTAMAEAWTPTVGTDRQRVGCPAIRRKPSRAGLAPVRRPAARIVDDLVRVLLAISPDIRPMISACPTSGADVLSMISLPGTAADVARTGDLLREAFRVNDLVRHRVPAQKASTPPTSRRSTSLCAPRTQRHRRGRSSCRLSPQCQSEGRVRRAAWRPSRTLLCHIGFRIRSASRTQTGPAFGGGLEARRVIGLRFMCCLLSKVVNSLRC